MTASGGGIDVSYASGTFSLVHSRVSDNQAVGVENAVAFGGGLSLYDVQVVLAFDTLQSNAAVGGSIVTNASLGQASGGALAIN